MHLGVGSVLVFSSLVIQILFRDAVSLLPLVTFEEPSLVVNTEHEIGFRLLGLLFVLLFTLQHGDLGIGKAETLDLYGLGAFLLVIFLHLDELFGCQVRAVFVFQV